MSDEQDADPLEIFDWTKFNSPTIAVVTAVAEEADVDPVTIEPLNEVVDPEALDNIFASMSYPQGSPNASIEFTYQNYRILVKANGRGYLYDQDESLRSTAKCQQFEPFKQAD